MNCNRHSTLTPPSLPLSYPPAPGTHSRRSNQAEKRKKNRPGIAPGRGIIYSISIFQSGFETAAGEPAKRNTSSIHRLSCAPSRRKLEIRGEGLHPLPRPAALGLPYDPCMQERQRVILEGVAVASAGGELLPGVVFRENARLQIDRQHGFSSFTNSDPWRRYMRHFPPPRRG